MSILDELAKPRIHETNLAARFGPHMRYEGNAPVFNAPLVCLAFSNRCGSNLLAEYLRDTPCFSGFHEQLNFDTVQKTCAMHGLNSFPDYIRHLCAAPIDAGRVYGFKTSWDQLMMLRRCKIDRMFTSVDIIHMTRSDIVGQAISLMIADQTKQWTSKQTPLADVQLEYRPALLKSLIHATTQSEQLVRILCEVNALPRTAVTYEALVADPASVITQVASAVGAELGNWIPKDPPISRQATALNDAIRVRFLSDLSSALQ